MKGLKTNYSYVLLFLLAVLLPTNAAAQSYRTRGGEILNCFGWTYKQINDNLKAIKDAEFSAIQVSSVQPMLPKDTKELWYTVGGEKQGVTIYVKKDRDTAPHLYVWLDDDDTKPNDGWPGKQMYKTCTIDGQDYWYETFKVDGLNIIFNDGQDLQDDELKKKSQTENITNVTSDTFYRLYTDTGADREYAYEPLSGITAPTKHVSVYAKATEAPYLNVWGNGINGNGNMPGAQMWKTENIDGTNYYYDSFAAETINYSFNDGSGNYTEGTNKTADITNITATKYYEVQKPGAFKVTEEDRITIYCKASKAPYLWAWNDKGNLTGDNWPGVEMTQTTTINGETFYYKTFKTDKINIIFSGGKEQTEDVNEIKADSYFEYDIEESKGNNLTQVTPGITIYCKAASAPNIWAWNPQNSGENYTGGEWPGKQMDGPTTIDRESYYYKTFNVANISFLLNNGNGGQTADITNVTRNRYFEYDGAKTAEDIEDYTLYVKVSGDIPYLYVWKDDGTKLLGDFPGQPLSTTTTIDGETYYTYNFKGKINFIIYSNGKQSGNLSADRDKFYSVSNITTYAATELTGINEPSNVYAPSWAFIYEPLGIRMADNLLGTVEEFKELVTKAHAQGLGVVVGVEANSVSNKEDKLDTKTNITKYLRKDYHGTEDWDMENREWITHHNVNVHTGVDYTCDLKTEDTGLQAIVKDFLDELDDAGVDGICWYHAKYIGVEQGHSYYNEAKGVPENPALSHNNLERDTFWENICNYWWTKKGKWCYGEIGADPFYKGNTDNPNHFECKWSHEDGYSRIVREYIFQMDLADAFYAKKNFTDGGCSWANGYWEAQTAEQAKLRKSMTITEFLDNKKTAGKSDLVYYAENADTYMQIWPEINGKSGGELYSSYDSNRDNQGVADRAYARVAGQDGATIVYFARPESPTSEIAPEELGSRALHFKTSPLVKELNKYHRIMNGYGEYITDNWDEGHGARTSLCREQGAIVIKRLPNNNTQGEDVEIANGGSRTAAGTYTDKVWGKTFTINKNTIKGKLGATGVAVLYDEQMVASQLAIVTPSSPNGEESFSNGGTIKVTSQLANYNLQVQWSNNSRFSNYSGKANQQTITAGDKTPHEISIDKTYAGSNYHTWIYLRYRAVDPNNSRRYGNWQYHYYDLLNEDNKSSDESSIFHILYFKIPEQLEQADKETERKAFLNSFKVYSWADQGNQAVVLTLPDGNPMPHPLKDGETVSPTWYRPVDLVYDGQAPEGDPAQIKSDGDTSYSDFVGNKKEYDPERGGSYCDVVTYAGQQFYRMTIGTPNFNFNVVNVQCNYDGKLLDTWTVDDDAFFDIQMDSDGRVSVAPLRRIVGDAVYNVGGFNNGKINFMDYSPKESTTTDKVYTYTGQFQKGKEFRIVAPIDYQNNYMYDSYNKDETCYKKYLKVYQTTQGVQIGGSSETDTENKLTFKSIYTQTQGKYQEAGKNSLSDAQNPTFNLPTGLYTIKLHEVTTYNETSGLSETVPYYEVMKPKVSVEGTNNTTVSMVVDNEADPKWWKADITVSDPQAVKGNKIVIRDVDDSSLFTPLEYQVDTPDDGLTGDALYKNYSEAGTYRVKHVMGYNQKSGEEETSVPAQDKLYLGFNLSKVGNGEPIKDTQGEDWSGYWGSFSDGEAREIPAGATAYRVSGYEKKENGGSEDFVIYLTKVSGTIPAETPLLLYYKDSDRSGIDDINIDVSNDAASCTFFMTTGDNPSPVGDNWLAAQVAISNADRFKEYTNYQSPYTQNPDNNNYVLSYQTVKGEKVLGFFKVTKFPSENLQFRKAFLSIPKATEARAVPLYWDAIMDFTNGVATSVSGLERGTAESQASYYNLQGIKVEKPTHGIYIRNGKKVIIK